MVNKSKKQDPGIVEFNYTTNYTVCKEFWDMEDSTARRSTKQALIKHRTWD